MITTSASGGGPRWPRCWPRRRDYSHLPAVIEDRQIPGDQCCCQRCGRPFAPVSGTADATVVEVDVKAHRRVIRRHRYRPTCACGAHRGIVTAPPAPRVIPKSILGVSIWVSVLLDKYLCYRPTYRLFADLRSHGLDLALGTLTDGLQFTCRTSRQGPNHDMIFRGAKALRQRKGDAPPHFRQYSMRKAAFWESRSHGQRTPI